MPQQPLGGLNELPKTPLSTASVSQRQWALSKTEAGGIVCSPASWVMARHCSATHTMLSRQRLHNGVERALPPHGTAQHFGLLAHQPAAGWSCCLRLVPSFFLGHRATLRQMMKVPNEPGLSPNNGLENAFLSDQSMASNPRKGQAKRFGAKTTSHDGKAGHVMTHVCHRARQEQRQVRPCNADAGSMHPCI